MDNETLRWKHLLAEIRWRQAHRDAKNAAPPITGEANG
jgi:hypothetical protein